MHNLNYTAIPQVIYDNKPEYIELYQKAWEIAWNHIGVNKGLPVERHMDEGFAKDRIWIWDTCFMVHFCKYSLDEFPGIQSLDNFYHIIYDGAPSSCLIQHADNPPLFAWVEYEYYLFTEDESRIRRNLVEKKYLQKHYNFLEKAKVGERYTHSYVINTLQKNECGYLWSGISSGMDNTPRGNDCYANLYWLDIIAQQALSALYISKMANIIREKKIAEEYRHEYLKKSEQINRFYYDSIDKCYYDIHATGHDPCRVLTPASFWPLLAEVADEEQAIAQAKTLIDDNLLGGDVPVPTVARTSPYFIPDGRYWRGGIWLPTSYMTAKALEKYHLFALASDIAEKTLNRMCATYKEYYPSTIWECYSPTENKPAFSKLEGEYCRPDFCGWSALGPISMLIENILGFYKVNAKERKLYYNYRDIGRHGIKGFRFGNIECSIISEGKVINVETSNDFCLVVNGNEYPCNYGKTKIHV